MMCEIVSKVKDFLRSQLVTYIANWLYLRYSAR